MGSLWHKSGFIDRRPHGIKVEACQPFCETSAASGFALVAVLLFLLLVSAVMAPFSVAAWSRAAIAHNQLREERLDLLAEGLLNVLAGRLENEATNQFPLNAEIVTCVVHDLTVAIQVQGHSGLIDLNAADRRLLSLGFASLRLEEEAATSLAIAVEYFRSGASVFAAAAKGTVSVSGGFKLAPFEAVAELQDFSRLDAVPIRDLYRTFTVNSRSRAVDLRRATQSLAETMTSAKYRMPVSASRNPIERAFTIEITVSQNGSGITGSAGYILEASARNGPGLRRVQLLPSAFTGNAPSAGSQGRVECGLVFGPSVRGFLERAH